MDDIRHFFQQVKSSLSLPIFKLGEAQLTLWTLLYLIFLFVLLLYVTSKIRHWLENRLLVLSRVEAGARQAAGFVFQYIVLLVGILIILQTAGIDLTTLIILAGAVGIGVGFGLQDIATNLVSGLIILFERPVRVGDRVEIAGVEGDVMRIGARSTTVVTNDNIAIIVPNAKFVTENVVNWSHTDQKVRFRIPVTVSYASDPRLVERLLLETAMENADVLRTPAPGARLLRFDPDGMYFELRAWTSNLLHRKGRFISALNFAISERFRQNGVEIPFPQRDIHIRSGSFPPAS